jgi:hypothetical protein
MVERTCYNGVPPASFEFALVWSKAETKEEAEPAHCLGLLVELDDVDDDGARPSTCHGEDGRNCPPEDELPSGHYTSFYRRLGI